MILILTEYLKWSSFLPNVLNDPHFRNSYFIWSFSVTPFKSLTEHCTSGTICIRICYVYCIGVVIRYLEINKWARVLVRNVWAVGEFWQSCSSIPNWCCCNLLLLPAIPLYRYVTVVPIFLPLPLVVIVGGNRVVSLRALLVVQREMD